MRHRPGDQPLPRQGTLGIYDLVVADLVGRGVSEGLVAFYRSREKLGIQRYGVSLQAHNGRDSNRDLQEELADASLYCRQALEEMDAGDPYRPAYAQMYADLLNQVVLVARRAAIRARTGTE